MATWAGWQNLPWHTESEFETGTRILVGTVASGNDVPNAVWCQNRSKAEADILLYLQDTARPYRTMLNRVPGELVPQYGKIRTTASYTHAVMVPDLVTTPGSHRKPFVWLNLRVPWGERFGVTPLVEGDDYSISGNNFTFPSAREGDFYVIEYEHTLRPVPDQLKFMSMGMTMANVIRAEYGTDQRRIEQWSEMFGNVVETQLKMLQEGRLDIPAFAQIKLYSDWEEGKRGVTSIPLIRT